MAGAKIIKYHPPLAMANAGAVGATVAWKVLGAQCCPSTGRSVKDAGHRLP